MKNRITFGSVAAAAVWSPDGSQIGYVVRRPNGIAIMQKAASGAGQERLVLEDGVDKFPLGWSPDGRFLLLNEVTGATRGRLWVMPTAPGEAAYRYPNTSFSETPAEFSPDGRWIAYVSNESGQKEVFVTPFPGPAGKWQVSQSGGDHPRWRRNGKELFYLTSERMMSATIDVSGTHFQVGELKPLFEQRWPDLRSLYDVSPDGQRFLVVTSDPTVVKPGFTVVVNWPATLR